MPLLHVLAVLVGAAVCAGVARAVRTLPVTSHPPHRSGSARWLGGFHRVLAHIGIAHVPYEGGDPAPAAPEFAQWLLAPGVEPTTATPAEYQALIRSEFAPRRRVGGEAGIAAAGAH